ncbi:MAG TPA: SDR family NAD(P)-dependent oxidoreductase [Chthonomonadaceae bacterium]|nr:SDR family NAD(P)-dependent oxidoreductase [Chthonomonadaceae bacterium]
MGDSGPWRHAIIVGASSGIGAELSRQLVRSGCAVALVARRGDELSHLAETLNAARPDAARVYVHDVREYECVPALFQTIARELGGLDLIVYAAGVMPAIEEDEYSFAKDRLMIEVNLLGAIAWLNEAALRFQRAGGGTIVGISSVAGERGRRTMPVYCTSKAALTTYLEALRNRVGRYGVKVVTVKPGPVDTPMTRNLAKKPLLIPAEQAARSILAAARRGASNAYIPGIWRWIFLVLRNMPSAIFKKLNF